MSVALRAGLFALWLPAAAMAQEDPPPPEESFTVVPAQPTTRTFVQLQFDSSGCSNVDDLLASADPAARELNVYIGEGDLCGDHTIHHVMPIGYLPAGDWRIRFYGCLAQDMTICSPSPRPDQFFSVVDAGRLRQTIPAGSTFAAFSLVSLLSLVALLRLKPG